MMLQRVLGSECLTAALKSVLEGRERWRRYGIGFTREGGLVAMVTDRDFRAPEEAARGTRGGGPC